MEASEQITSILLN